MNTVELDSYYPGYDKYCDSENQTDYNDSPEIDKVIDDFMIERLERKESE